MPTLANVCKKKLYKDYLPIKNTTVINGRKMHIFFCFLTFQVHLLKHIQGTGQNDWGKNTLGSVRLWAKFPCYGTLWKGKCTGTLLARSHSNPLLQQQPLIHCSMHASKKHGFVNKTVYPMLKLSYSIVYSTKWSHTVLNRSSLIFVIIIVW